MNLERLIHCCLYSDPDIVSGDYTVIISNSKSGALNAGVLLFTQSDIGKRSATKVEYRLVSILVMLSDLQKHLSEHADQTNFQLTLADDFRTQSQECADQLIEALKNRGIRSEIATELVFGGKKLS